LVEFNVLKFGMLFQNKNRCVLRNLCKFIRVINIIVGRPGLPPISVAPFILRANLLWSNWFQFMV